MSAEAEAAARMRSGEVKIASVSPIVEALLVAHPDWTIDRATHEAERGVLAVRRSKTAILGSGAAPASAFGGGSAVVMTPVPREPRRP